MISTVRDGKSSSRASVIAHRAADFDGFVNVKKVWYSNGFG